MIKLDGYRKFAAGLALIAALTGCSTKVPNDPTKTTEPTQEVTPTTTPEVVEEDIILSDEELIVALGDIVNEVNTTPNVTMTGTDIYSVYKVFNNQLENGTPVRGVDLSDSLYGYTNDNGETFGGVKSLARYIATKYVNGDSDIIDLSVLFNNTKDKKAYNDFMNEFQKALAAKDNELVGALLEEFIISEKNSPNVKYLITYSIDDITNLGENITYIEDKVYPKFFAAEDVIYERHDAMEENPYNEAADLSDEIDNYINSKTK